MINIPAQAIIDQLNAQWSQMFQDKVMQLATVQAVNQQLEKENTELREEINNGASQSAG